MKLWFLEYPDADFFADETGAMVVSALTLRQARIVASKVHLAEGSDVWLDNTKTTCEEITNEETARVIIRGW